MAALSCPAPRSLLCMLCTVRHAEGEIKVKVTSTGSCSGGTQTYTDVQSRESLHTESHMCTLMQKNLNVCMPVCSLFCQCSTVMDEPACGAHGESLHEAQRRPFSAQRLRRNEHRERQRSSRYTQAELHTHTHVHLSTCTHTKKDKHEDTNRYTCFHNQ